MEDERLYFNASDISISEQKQNDIFLCISMRMLSTLPNKNKEGVTKEFIDEIVSNPEKYLCLPLYADVEKLVERDYGALGHMFNRFTGKFRSTQVGGFASLSKTEDEFGTSLIGEARVPKRESDICQCIAELYESGALGFSFEITCNKEDTVVKDGVRYVDVSPRNLLTGMAIVSHPACEEAVAQSLVAEDGEATGLDKIKGVDSVMTQEEALALIEENKKYITELENQINEMKKGAPGGGEPPCEECEPEDLEAARKKCADEIAAEKKRCADEIEAARKKCAEDVEAARKKCAEDLGVKDQKIAELEPFKQKLEKLQAEAKEAELKADQENAKLFAENQGLDMKTKEVSDAVEKLDYAALAKMTMKKAKTVTLASFVMTDGPETSEPFGGLLESR